MTPAPDCNPLKTRYTPEGEGQCAECEVDFYTAGQGEHYKHLCQSCERDRVDKELAEIDQQEQQTHEVHTVANLVEQLQQCLDGTVHARGVQDALVAGRMLLARWQKEGRRAYRQRKGQLGPDIPKEVSQ